ncbi:MAG: type II toxin-antitoxin system HicA family toxin [Chloroflexi bacterium]|nr:type II toxin-antitoxin system HicA family toxin [Chloroflexota bacterium]
MAKPHLMVEYYDLVKRRELWRRLAERPRNVRFEEVDQLLRLSGWKLNHVRGSHYVYRSPEGRHLSIPRHGSPVKPGYVRAVLGYTRGPGDE